MKVKKLQELLSKLDQDTDVYVYWEEGKERRFFGIYDAYVARGKPRRQPDGRVGFIFDQDGPASWAFLSVGPE